MAAEADPTRTRDHCDVDISAFKTRGIYIDPSFKLDQITLKRVTRMVLVLPLVNGATALLELLPRPLLLFLALLIFLALLLFLALSFAPHHRTVMWCGDSARQ